MGNFEDKQEEHQGATSQPSNSGPVGMMEGRQEASPSPSTGYYPLISVCSSAPPPTGCVVTFPIFRRPVRQQAEAAG